MNRLIFITSFIFITIMAHSQTISLIGSATPAANWYIDFNMNQDLQNPLVWTINITLTDGEVKFRQDAGWDVSWGGIDFPSGMAITDGPNIPVTAGNYDVVLNTGEPYYEFILNTSYGNVGINNDNPQEKLDVNGNIRFSGELKPNGVSGTTGQMLKSNGDGTMGWAEASASSSGPVGQNGSVGFGTWGGCDMANVSEYNPVSDPDGQLGDRFGWSVAMSGDYAIAGAWQDDDANGTEQGSAIIFKRNFTSGLWEPEGTKLFNPDAQADDYFGESVAISGDFAIVGAFVDDDAAGIDQGSASIFLRNSSTGEWELQGSKLLDPDAAAGDQFGISVSISGDFAIIGANGDDDAAGTDQGSACIFRRNTGTGAWEFEAKILDPDAASDDGFGASVCISGEYIIIGAEMDDDVAGASQGSACIFWRNTSTEIWELQGSKLLNIAASDHDYFGCSVSISGDYAIIGASGDDAAGALAGSASIFKRNLTTGAWQFQGSKLLNTDPVIIDRFGTTVCISGNYAIVGAYLDDDIAGSNQGTATIFANTGSLWQKLQKITDSGQAGDNLGRSCCIDATTKRFLIGSTGAVSSQGKVLFGKTQ